MAVSLFSPSSNTTKTSAHVEQDGYTTLRRFMVASFPDWCESRSTSGGRKFTESLDFVFIKLPLPVLTGC